MDRAAGVELAVTEEDTIAIDRGGKGVVRDDPSFAHLAIAVPEMAGDAVDADGIISIASYIAAFVNSKEGLQWFGATRLRYTG